MKYLLIIHLVYAGPHQGGMTSVSIPAEDTFHCAEMYEDYMKQPEVKSPRLSNVRTSYKCIKVKR